MHRDKLTPRFKANSPTRKLSARVGTYLSGLLHFLGVLEVGLRDCRRPLHARTDVGLDLYYKLVSPASPAVFLSLAAFLKRPPIRVWNDVRQFISLQAGWRCY